MLHFSTGKPKCKWPAETTMSEKFYSQLSHCNQFIKRRLDFMSSIDFIFKVIHEPEYIGD